MTTSRRRVASCSDLLPHAHRYAPTQGACLWACGVQTRIRGVPRPVGSAHGSHGCGRHGHVLCRPWRWGPQMSEENGMAPAVGTAFGKGAKSIYTCLYIYAKGPLVLHKYTAVTAALRGVISGKTHQTRTGFVVFGAVLGPCEGRKSNNLLQNRDIQCLSRPCFRLFRGRFLGVPRWSFFCSRWSLRF